MFTRGEIFKCLNIEEQLTDNNIKHPDLVKAISIGKEHGEAVAIWYLIRSSAPRGPIALC